MKQVLSLLTAYVFLQMQTWALSGGPVFANQASPNMAGVYSGVFIPQKTTFGTGVAENERTPAGKNGVFTITVPPTGLADGTIVFFVNGSIFSGTMTGVADPDKRHIDAVMEATGNFGVVIQPQQVFIVNGQVIIIPAVIDSPDLQGSFEADIIEDFSRPIAGFPDTTTGNAARLKGKATVDVFVNVQDNQTPDALVQTKYSVSGFRQLTTAVQ